MPAETPTGTHQASLCRVPVGREVRSVAMGAMTNAWLARLSRHRPHGRKRSSATQAGQSHSVGCAEHLAIAKRYGNCLMCDSPLMLREETHDRRWGWAGLHIPPNAKGGNSKGVLGRWGGCLQKGASPPISNRLKCYVLIGYEIGGVQTRLESPRRFSKENGRGTRFLRRREVFHKVK